MGITLDEILLDATTSNIAISDGTDTLAINADGSLNATITATDLDIRDLINTQDSIAIGDSIDIIDVQTIDSAFDALGKGFILAGVRQDAAGSPVSATGDTHPLVFNNDGELKVVADVVTAVADDAIDSGNPIKIGGHAVSGALTALSASDDRYALLGDLFRRTWVNTSANIGINTEAASVTTVAAEVLVTPLSGRRFVTIQNRGNQSVFILESGAIAKTEGTEIPKGSSATYDFGEDINIFLVSDVGTQDVRLLEAG